MTPLLLVLIACAPKAHLAPDFAESYTAAFAEQAVLDDPSQAYEIRGPEALQLRERAAERATDDASAEPLQASE